MKKCSRCKVLKDIKEFKRSNSKTCNRCREIAREAYKLKKAGKLPKYAEVSKQLEAAYSKGNFICNVCNKEKSLDNFGLHSNANKYGICRVCKECSRNKNKFSKLYKKYNLSEEAFIKTLKNQDNKCKICKSEIKFLSRYQDKNKSACVDHCHKTGKLRGLLCNSCNRGIGFLKDDSKVLYNAYKYLIDNE